MRVVVTGKLVAAVMRRLVQPNRIVVLRLGKRIVSQEVAAGCVAMLVAVVILVRGTGLILNMMGLDMMTAMGAALTCVTNAGPGFGVVGPSDTFAGVPGPGNLLPALNMVAGRLEVFTVLMLLSPGFWRR